MLLTHPIGFYSSLELVADHFPEIPPIAKVNQLLDQFEIATVNGRLSEDITELFKDRAAWEENEDFFHPDSISVRHEIEIMHPEYDSWDSQGISISIHGGGYFYPWGTEQLVAVIKHPKLIALHDAVEKHSAAASSLRSPHPQPLRKHSSTENAIGSGSGHSPSQLHCGQLW